VEISQDRKQSLTHNGPFLMRSSPNECVVEESESVLDKLLTFTYHTQAFATGLTEVAEECFTATRSK
jgi:hypothetical protein